MKRRGDFIWASVLIIISTFLILPQTNKIYTYLNSIHPFILAFLKFSILATMGELLALRIISARWVKTKGVFTKAIVWGIVGITVVFMFMLFPLGIVGLVNKGVLYGGTGFGRTLLIGIYTSIVLNFAFAPVFMSVHRISDTFIDMRVGGLKPKIGEVIEKIDWPAFIKFVMGKTIPFFWIPVHTITFILPENYRVLFAAYLSIALGIILAYAKKKAVNSARNSCRELDHYSKKGQ